MQWLKKKEMNQNLLFDDYTMKDKRNKNDILDVLMLVEVKCKEAVTTHLRTIRKR